MSVLVGDHLTQVAFSVYEGKGVFALLLGSGLSRAAGIPTGWEITLDLVRRAGRAQGVPEQTNWAEWYQKKAGKEPDYSALLEELASSPVERRSILHRYIEPTAQEMSNGQKIQTDAHYAIADLVARGYFRVIVTTNFDRLMENALRERGIEPTIVASIDALSGAEPITHSDCYILKLHGDYKDARILNTEVELGSYPAPYNGMLDRILDEHGLIVCGWSGEWDTALRSALLRAPNRRYPVFWTTCGELGGGAEEIIKHRKGRTIPIADADGFFSSLKQRIETLEQTQRQNPLNVDLLVNSTKRFLARPEHRIQLDEIFTAETERVLTQLDDAGLIPNGSFDEGELRRRVRRYESVAESLAIMAGVMGRWGNDSEIPLICDILQALYTHAEKEKNGLVAYLDLRYYPAVLVFTAYGLGLTRAGRWRTLHGLFGGLIARQHHEPLRAVEALFHLDRGGGEANLWLHMEGLNRRITPFSDHLHSVFIEWGRRFTGLTPEFSLLFGRFEILGSLAHFEVNNKEGVKVLHEGDRQARASMPVGRIGWNRSDAERLVRDIRSLPTKTALIQAGFAQGDPEFFDIFVDNFQRISSRMRW